MGRIVLPRGCLAAALCLLALAAVSTAQSNLTVISGVEFDYLQLFARSSGMVYHMEEDMSRKGFIMFSDGASLKTTNGRLTYTIVGEADVPGNYESVGNAARLGWVTGFTQLNETHVVIVDYSNHCLRMVDRTSNVPSKFVGQCGTPGYVNGLDAYFTNPWSVMRDGKEPSTLIVSDSRNQALRYVDIKFRSVFTYLDKRNGLNYPYGMAYDQRKQNLFTTNTHYVMAHGVDDDNNIRITGNFSNSFSDGTLQTSRFGVPAEIVSLRDHLLLLADQDNNVLRLLDLKQKNVSSICIRTNNSNIESLNGTVSTCKLYNPRSILVAGGYVYVGQYQGISRVGVKLPANEIPPLLPGESLAGCPDTTNRTFIVKTGDDRVAIDLLPDTIFYLSVGEHQIFLKDRNCTVDIVVENEIPDKGQGCPTGKTEQLLAGEQTVEVEIFTGEYLVLPEGEYQYTKPDENCTVNVTVLGAPSNKTAPRACPPNPITLVVEDNEKTATYTIVEDGVMHNIELPVGTHETRIDDGYLNCTLTIMVIDYRLKRRLNFQSKYNIKCTELCCTTTANQTQDLVELVAENKYQVIEQLCPKQGRCSKNDSVIIDCDSVNSVTTITWPTELYYPGNIKQVPASDEAAFRKALSAQTKILDMILPTRPVPVVFPMLNSNQEPVELVLETICLENRSYDSSTDSCV